MIVERTTPSSILALAGSNRLASHLLRVVDTVAHESCSAATLQQIVASFVNELGAVRACVYLLGPDERTLHVVASSHGGGATDAGTAALEENHPAARAAKTGRLQWLAESGKESGVGEVALALPLFACARKVGVVSAVFRGFIRANDDALEALGDALGALIEREQLRDQVVQATTRARDRVVRTARVAHDMRQPLNVIGLIGGFLARRGDKDQERALERVRGSVMLLERMVDDLLDAAFLDTGHATLRRVPTDIAKLVNAAVARHAPNARTNVDGDVPHVEVDPQRIEQVLMNLLVNAKKHGRPNGLIAVDVESKGSAVMITVTNEGTAIREEDSGRIFDPLYQAPGHDHSGLGLGLHICKSLVEEHGGRIWTEPAPDGTRFCFSLPTSSAAGGLGRASPPC
jgi:signal transduction histidine kinase